MLLLQGQLASPWKSILNMQEPQGLPNSPQTRAVYLPAPHLLCYHPSSRLFAKVAVTSFPISTVLAMWLRSSACEETVISPPLNLGWPPDPPRPAQCCRGDGVPVLSPGLRSSCLSTYSLGSLHSPHVNEPKSCGGQWGCGADCRCTTEPSPDPASPARVGSTA